MMAPVPPICATVAPFRPSALPAQEGSSATDGSSELFVGLLDVFGFESFDTN